MTEAELSRLQEEICRKYRLAWTAAPRHLIVGIAENVKSGLLPINGLRHPPRSAAGDVRRALGALHRVRFAQQRSWERPWDVTP